MESIRQRIQESSCAKKETIDILVTSRNGDRKIIEHTPHSTIFFEPPPIQNQCLPWGTPSPPLKNEAPIRKTNPPLKSEAPFQERIPRKNK